MADEKDSKNGSAKSSSASRSRSNGSSGSRSSSSRSRSSSSKRLSGREAIEQVRHDLPALLGKPLEAVLGLEPDQDQDGGWHVTVSVVELARIPNSTDVLGAYRVSLDSKGELAGYRRVRRYQRNQADED